MPRTSTARARLLGVALIAGLAWSIDAGLAEARAFDARSALDLSEKAVGGSLGRHRLRTPDGRMVSLDSYRGKPLVVSLIYTGCADICPTVSETLARAAQAGRAAMGDDSFRIITVGFDARNDTPARMRAYAASRGLDLAGWDFLSADAATVDALARDLGFTFFPSPKGFDHMSQTSIVDAEGVVYRHVYGANFDPPQLIEPLKDLVFGRQGNLASIEGIINRVRLFCTLYDASSDRYRFDYSIFIAIAIGALALGGMGAILVRGAVDHWRTTGRG